MYVFVEPGTKAKGAIRAVMEAHEVGEVLIPIYLVLHVGAAVLHAVFGKPVWHRIFGRARRTTNNTVLVSRTAIGPAPILARAEFVYLDFHGRGRRFAALGYLALEEHS